MKTRTTGLLAESLAQDYLLAKGYQPIISNYSCKFGEIDLIMKDHDQIVFIEVRFRSNRHHGSALESVHRNKQGKLIRTANHYLQSHDLLTQSARIDVVALTPLTASAALTPTSGNCRFEHVISAIEE